MFPNLSRSKVISYLTPIPTIFVTTCTDVHCSNQAHCDEIDKFARDILSCIESAAFETLPIVKQGQSKKEKNIHAGWSEEVKPFRDNAYFWSQIWKSAGKPQNCELHRIMKRTRNLYHYQYKKCKKSEEMIKRNKLLNACLNSDKDLFEEIKKMRRTNEVVASSMDGKTEDIPGHFKEIYSQLYNSVDDREDLEKICDTVEQKINFSSIYDVKKVTPSIVKEASKNLQPNILYVHSPLTASKMDLTIFMIFFPC